MTPSGSGRSFSFARENGRPLWRRSLPRPGTGPRDVRTILAAVFGIGYLVYAVAMIPPMVSQAAPVLPGWYPPVAAVLAFGPGIALLPAAAVSSWNRAVPPLIVCCTGGLLAASGIWLYFADGAAAETAGWILNFAGLAALTLVLIRPITESIIALAVVKFLGAAVSVTAVAHADIADAVEEALFGIAFSTVFLLLLARVLTLDDEMGRSRAATEDLAARDLADVEAARVDALIHDHVLATFMAAAADPDDPRIVDHAASALNALDSVVDPRVESTEISGGDVVARLRAVLTGVDGDLPVTVEISADDARYPSVVVAALAEAAAEAARNSYAHAGPDAQRMALIGVAPELLQIVVTDDGVGFDPTAVPGDRLGLDLSISHRVGVLTGGDVAVISEPGHGCTVRLRWRRPANGGPR